MAESTPTVAQRPVPLVPQPEFTPTVNLGPDRAPRTDAVAIGRSPFPVVEGYEIEAELGRGGMGVVYAARQVSLNRRVALKTIRTTVGASAADVRRFLAEAEVLAAVRHPNVVQVFECGVSRPERGSDDDAFPYIALELVAGGTLARLLHDRGRLEPRDAAALLAAVADGVQTAHEAGIVHRDLKPANILLDTGAHPDGAVSGAVPKVSDFGVARRSGTDLTATGATVGTPDYMAPEQADGRSKFVGPAADVWALGVVLFEALTGQRPFRGDGAWPVLLEVLNTPAPALRRLAPAVPSDLELICHKCLEKEPRHRYASAAEVADDLRRFLANEPVTVRPLGPFARSWRVARRNPLVAGLLAAFVVSHTIGIGFSVSKALEASRSADQANTEATRARAEEAKANQEAANARNALVAKSREEAARKAADEFALCALRTALSSRELGEAWRALETGDVPATERALAGCPPESRGWEWRLLDNWLARAAPVLSPVPGPFTPKRFAVSPDGRWVAACGEPNNPQGPPFAGTNGVWVWDVVSGSPPVPLGGNFVLPPRVLAFGPNGRLVAASDDAVRVWCVDAPKRAALDDKLAPAGWEPSQLLPHVLAVRLDADRVTALVGSLDQKKCAKFVRWTFGADAERSETELPESAGATAAAFAPDGKSLVLTCGGWHGTVRRVELDGKVLGGPVALAGTPVFVGCSPNGTGAVVGVLTSPGGGELLAWDGTATKFALRSAFSGGIQTGEVLRDGRVLATSHPSGLWAWNPTTGATEVPGRFDFISGATAFPDSRRLVVGDLQRGPRLWTAPPAHSSELTGESRFASGSLDGDRILVPGSGGLLIRTRAEGALTRHAPEPVPGGYRATAWAGDRVALLGEPGKSATPFRLYDPETKSVTARWELPGSEPVSAFAADRHRVALCAHDSADVSGAVQLFDAHSGTPLKFLRVPQAAGIASDLVFSPNGKYLAAARTYPRATVSGVEGAPIVPGRLTLWDCDTGECLWDVDAPDGVVRPAFTADSSWVIAEGRGSTLFARNTHAGTVAREFVIPTTRAAGAARARGPGVRSLAFAPDSTRLVATGSVGLTVWDCVTGQVAHTIPTASEAVSFSADGSRLHVSNERKLLTYVTAPR